MNQFLSVDRFCLVGGGFFAVGFLIAAFAVIRWMAIGFGDLDAAVNIRLAAYSTLGMALGVQSVTAGFLLGLVRTHRRRTSAGQPPVDMEKRESTRGEDTEHTDSRTDAAA
jgi:hypothetical protein